MVTDSSTQFQSSSSPSSFYYCSCFKLPPRSAKLFVIHFQQYSHWSILQWQLNLFHWRKAVSETQEMLKLLFRCVLFDMSGSCCDISVLFWALTVCLKWRQHIYRGQQNLNVTAVYRLLYCSHIREWQVPVILMESLCVLSNIPQLMVESRAPNIQVLIRLIRYLLSRNRYIANLHIYTHNEMIV